MKPLPRLSSLNAERSDDADSVVLAVFAPFGADPVLSHYPDGKRKPIRQHPLVRQLQKVARQGVNVSALVDLVRDDTYLIEIPAGLPQQMAIHSVWKQQMNAPQSLAGFLRRTHARFPCSTPVLALEGHGAGYLPEINGGIVDPKSTTDDGRIAWKFTQGAAQAVDANTGAPMLLLVPSPELPCESPEGRAISLPMSTWGLGQALASAVKDGVRRPAVIHFNNCLNMSVEVLHTAAPYADYATGYANYNFFTCGEAYPEVFKKLRRAGVASAEQVARWFAAANGALLHSLRNHPTVGATIALARLTGVCDALNALAKELTDALRSAGGDAVREHIKTAVRAAQQYDTEQGFELEVPDQITDLADFAFCLQRQFAAGSIHDKARTLQQALVDVWQYGDYDRPWVDEQQIWDFRNRRIGISIFMPDPTIEGLWDWRSPFYMKNHLEADKAPSQPDVIDFLTDSSGRCPWVKFLVEYHNVKTVPANGRLLRARPPLAPVVNREFKPTLPHPADNDSPCDPDAEQQGQGEKPGRAPGAARAN